jgi:chromosome segregation ATPase
MDSEKNLEQEEYIIIPNPIYDVVFKYLMEDHDSAEDDYTRVLKDRDNKISFYKEKYRAANQELDNERKIRLQAEAETEKLQVEIEKLQVETEKLQAETEKLQVETEKLQAETEKLQVETEKLQTEAKKQQANLKSEIVIMYHVKKKSKLEISEILGLSIDEIDEIIE